MAACRQAAVGMPALALSLLVLLASTDGSAALRPSSTGEAPRESVVSDKHLSKPPAARAATEAATARVENVMQAPTPTAQCHASSLVALRDGTVLVAWFGGTKEGHPDVGIWVSSAPTLRQAAKKSPRHCNPPRSAA